LKAEAIKASSTSAQKQGAHVHTDNEDTARVFITKHNSCSEKKPRASLQPKHDCRLSLSVHTDIADTPIVFITQTQLTL
jgi:hypothetical protein